MKEYKMVEDNAMVAGKPQAAYSRVSREPYVSHALMDELMNQSDEAKRYIISQFSESMMKEEEEVQEREIQTKRKGIEAKLDELHVTGSLRRLLGAASFIDEDDDWKTFTFAEIQVWTPEEFLAVTK